MLPLLLPPDSVDAIVGDAGLTETVDAGADATAAAAAAAAAAAVRRDKLSGRSEFDEVTGLKRGDIKSGFDRLGNIE